MRKCAIVTGATGGLGKEFVRQLDARDVDVVIAVGRNESKLAELSKRSGNRVQTLKADLATDEGIELVRDAMADTDIRYLVNNAGVAYMGKFEDMTEEKVAGIVDLNCRACALIARMAIPHMTSGAVILNVSSASSFQPNPYLTMYSASKVFLKNFSRALNMELKDKGILSVAVCPGWVDTDMLKSDDGSKAKFPGMVTAEKVVTKALTDADRKRDVSLSSLLYSYFRVYSKIVPTRIVMNQWMMSVRKYIR